MSAARVGSKSSTGEIRNAIQALQADISGTVEQNQIDELMQLLRDRDTDAARDALAAVADEG